MANFNKVLLIGNLTRDPELRYIPSGTAVANFSLATNRVYMTSSGEKKQETCFVRVVVWGRIAETCGEYLSKGSQVFVEGRLQYRTWDSPSGEKRNTLEVRAERVQFLSRSDKAGQPRQANKGVEDINLEAEPQGSNGSGKVESGRPNSEEVPF